MRVHGNMAAARQAAPDDEHALARRRWARTQGQAPGARSILTLTSRLILTLQVLVQGAKCVSTATGQQLGTRHQRTCACTSCWATTQGQAPGREKRTDTDKQTYSDLALACAGCQVRVHSNGAAAWHAASDERTRAQCSRPWAHGQAAAREDCSQRARRARSSTGYAARQGGPAPGLDCACK